MRPLVFDLDGTLIDSKRDITAACNYALKKLGREEQSQDQICQYVGNGAGALTSQVFGYGADDPRLVEAEEHFQFHYRNFPAEYATLLPGVKEALALGKTRTLALCSNKPHDVTLLTLDAMNLSQHFEVILGATAEIPKKPAADMLLYIAVKLDVPASDLIMVGDGPQDIGAAHAAGCHAIGVEGGILPETDLNTFNPHIVLASLEDLPKYLEQSKI